MQPTFGAIARTPDPRDYQLGTVNAGAFYPSSHTTDFSQIPVEMQNQIPNCGAEAGNFLKEAFEQMVGTSVHLSPSALWKEIKGIDGFSPSDGTNMLSIFKALQKQGIPKYGMLSEDTTLPLATYSDAISLTPEIKADALSRRIGTYAFTFNPTEAQLKQAIFNNNIVLALVEVGKEWWTNSNGVGDWSPAILPIKPPQSIVSGHFIVIYGYELINETTTRYYFRNWWSTGWANGGNGYFDSNYVPFIREIGTAVDLPDRYPFNNNLSLGMSSPDVKELQKVLNKDTRTQVATAGDGSAGKETYYFGGLTKSALIKYQTLHGLPQTGYFGPMTRAEMNK